MSETNTIIGKPVYGNQSNSRPNAANANWKIDKEGSHVYRILPPFGSLANAGRWSQYEAVHWGFSLSNGKKRAFRCIQRKNPKTRMVEIECPMCKKIAEKTKNRDTQREKFLGQGKSETEVNALLQPLNDWLMTFNLQKGHYLNVMRPDGQIGKLFIKIKMKQDLDLKLPKFMEKYEVDPIAADQGMWLAFTRHGMGRNDSVYGVEPVEESIEINGRKYLDIKKAPLSNDTINRMAKEAFDLSTSFKELTYDEVEAMVDSDGDPSVVDAIFGAPAMTNIPAPESEGGTGFTDTTPDVVEEIQRKMAGKKVSKPKTEVASDADFMAQFKAGKL